MMPSWMDNLRSWLQPGPGHKGRRARRGARLKVEGLEDRDVPSITVGGPAPILGPPPQWLVAGPVGVNNSSGNILPPGPTNLAAGATESISVDPFNPNRVAIGTVNGGVWITNDYTQPNPTWTTNTDSLPSLAIASVAFSPVTQNTIYAGTGSYTNGGLGPNLAAGIGTKFPGDGGAAGLTYKSTDGGQTWSQIGGTTLAGQRIQSLVPTALNGGQTIFAATSDVLSSTTGGVYRSTDGGATWVRQSGANGLPNLGVTSLIADPANPNIFFAAAVAQAGTVIGPGTLPGIYMLDASKGNTAWKNISTNLSQTTLNGAARIVLAASGAGAQPLYAAVAQDLGGGSATIQGVYRSVNYATGSAGASTNIWAAVGPAGLPPDITRGQQAETNLAIVADPGSDQFVYVTGDTVNSNGIQGLVARGDAIANTWTAITATGTLAPATPGTTQPLVTTPAPTTAPHPDARWMAFAGGNILEANDGGVYEVTNPGGAGGVAPNWSSINGNLTTTELYSTAIDNRKTADPSDDVYLAAAQDNGESEGLAGTAFPEVAGGDGTLVLVDQVNGFRYYSAQGFALTRRNPNGTLVNPPAVINGTAFTLSGSLGFIPAAVKGQVYQGQLLAGGNGPFLFISFDHADSFDSVGGVAGGRPLPVPGITGNVIQLAFGTTQTPEAAYVATDDGNIFRTFDVPGIVNGQSSFATTNFKTVAGGLLANGIVMDPNNPLIAYAVTNRGVFKTVDGLNWTAITGNILNLTLPGGLTTLSSIALFDNNTTVSSDDAVLVGGYGGVFELPNQAQTNGWVKFGAGLPNAVVSQLVYDPLSDTLVAATYGRGVWRVPNASNDLLPGLSIIARGDLNSNDMAVYPDLTDPKFFFVSDGLGNLQRFDSTFFRAVFFRGLAGDDTIRVGSPDDATPGRTDLLKVSVLPDGGSNAGDTLIIDDRGDTVGRQVTITGNTVGGGKGDTLLARFGAVQFTGFDGGGVQVRMGSGNDQMIFDDSANPASTQWVIDGTRVTRTGVGTPIDYTGLEQMVIRGGTGVNTYTVNHTGATLSTDVEDGPGNGVFNINGSGLQGTTSFRGNAGNDTFNLNANTGITGSVFLSGGIGTDAAVVTGTTGSDAATFTFTNGTGSGTFSGLGAAVAVEAMETVDYNSGGGTDSLTWADGTNTSLGNTSDPDSGITYIPTGASSGKVAVQRGSVYPLFRFAGVNGPFAINGDAGGTGARDVLAVYGVSDTGLASPAGETTAASGADTIHVSDQGVTIANTTLGTLKGVSFAQTNGAPTFAAVYVKTGNEGGRTGDTVIAVPTNQFNLVIDGMAPVGVSPGNRIQIQAAGPTKRFPVSDPTLGPPHTVVQQINDGASVGFLNFQEGVGAGSGTVVVGTGAGVETFVQVFDPVTGQLKFQFTPFPGFFGGVSVAAGDVNGDGVPDVIVGAGPGGAPFVNVYDGVTGSLLYGFLAFEPTFSGGVTVSAADFNKDGFADIVLGTGVGGGPHVVVVDGRDQQQLLSVFVYEPTFRGGVNVAVGDFNGDGIPDLVTSTQAGGGPRVVIFDGSNLTQIASFFVFDPADRAGFSVAVGDVNGDGVPDVVVGSGAGDPAEVRVFSGVGFGLVADLFLNDPFDPTATAPIIPNDVGVRVATADATGDGTPEIVTAKGPGSVPTLRFFQLAGVNPATNALTTGPTEVKDLNVFDPSYGGGVFVGGG
jgi:hypothetical protein